MNELALKARSYRPMLCQDSKGELPNGGGWSYEVKLDGYRCLAAVDGHGGVEMASRSAKSSYTEQFPVVARALADLPIDCVLDGELVVMDEKGGTSMQNIPDHRDEAVFVVYDCLEVGGIRATQQTLEQRRELLRGLVVPLGSQHVQESPVFDDGEALMKTAREHGWEGLVAKKLGTRYMEGSRPPIWLKVKIRCSQEFAVVGYTPGENARAGQIGALILAVWENDGWVVVGKAGTGQTKRLGDFWAELELTPAGPFLGDVTRLKQADRRVAVWVEPEVVVQVEFQKWTKDGALWHPSVIALRTDKEPKECSR